MFRTYGSAYQYLCRFTDYERMAQFHYDQTTFNLKRMRCLLKCIGNPHQELKTIHIAGTKGKGSTALILTSILKESNYRVGLFTSPHLVSLQERIQINGEPISKQAFTRIMNRLHPHLHKIHPTFFEIITACALLYFQEQQVDWAIMEVGLGGRLDATNVITPKTSIITRIDFDHMDKLGHTLTKIAREKAGIIKKNVPVIALRQNPAVNGVIRKVAHKYYAPIHWVRSHRARLKNPRSAHFSVLKYNVKQTKVCIPMFLQRRGIRLGNALLGKHQLENTGLALSALKFLKSTRLIDISNSAIRKALKNTSLPARIEIIHRKPLIILDSAHNPAAIQALKDTITKTFLIRNPQVILIISIAKDKEIQKILDILLPMASIVIFTQARNPRMCKPIEFIKYLPAPYPSPPRLPAGQAGEGKGEGKAIPIFLEKDSRKALGLAIRLARPKDMIVITGSFYLAGEIKSLSRLSGKGSRRLQPAK